MNKETKIGFIIASMGLCFSSFGMNNPLAILVVMLIGLGLNGYVTFFVDTTAKDSKGSPNHSEPLTKSEAQSEPGDSHS